MDYIIIDEKGANMNKKMVIKLTGVFALIILSTIINGCVKQPVEEKSPEVDIKMKVPSDILEEGVSPWARNIDNTVNLTVIFTEDTSFEEAVEIIQRNGGQYIDDLEGIHITASNWHNILIIIINESRIVDLANEKEIEWINEVPPEPSIYQND